MRIAIAALLLLAAGTAGAAVRPEDLPILKTALAPYAALSDDAAAAAMNTPRAYLEPQWINRRTLYDDVGPDKAENFIAILATLSDATKFPGTAVPASAIREWITASYGVDIGPGGVRDWLIKVGTYSTGLAAAFKPILDLAVKMRTPADVAMLPPVTLDEVKAARALP